MLSLYIHIPFCSHKCAYCSFFVLPENDAQLVDKEMKLEQLKERYLESLLAENASRKSTYPDQQIKTIYIGGGTPFELGEERLFKLIDTLLETRDVEFLEELTIELNPDPFDEVLNFIRQANRKYKHLYKLRFSVGIQTFDDDILTASKRNYVFNNLIRFFRDLQKIKQSYTFYNFDFIAFGKKGEEYPWDTTKMEFFTKIANSHVADGFSLYTLELFPGSSWYNKYHSHKKTDNFPFKGEMPKAEGFDEQRKKIHRLQSNDDAIYHEFDTLKTIITQAGYLRNEISNFSLMGKQSSHNMVYRTMQPYIGLGINSSSFLENKRFSNTKHRKKYLAGERQDTESNEELDEQTYAIEQAFLALRTSAGLKSFRSYTGLFESNREEQIAAREENGLAKYNEATDTLKFSDTGMNVYNALITDLFASL